MKLFALLFIPLFFISGRPVQAGEWEEPVKSLQSPGSEWQTKRKTGEVEFGIKGKSDAVNVSVRIFKDVPLAVPNFLGQVRTQMMADKRYSGASMDSVRSESRGGTEWSFFKVNADPELYQELWARRIGDDAVLIAMFTAIGVYYEKYHPGFEEVLRQASSGPIKTQSLDQQLGKKISLTGIAQNEKLGAALAVDGRSVYIKDKDAWPAELLKQTLRVTGTLKKFELPVATQTDGAWSAGVSEAGSAYRLQDVQWERTGS